MTKKKKIPPIERLAGEEYKKIKHARDEKRRAKIAKNAEKKAAKWQGAAKNEQKEAAKNKKKNLLAILEKQQKQAGGEIRNGQEKIRLLKAEITEIQGEIKSLENQRLVKKTEQNMAKNRIAQIKGLSKGLKLAARKAKSNKRQMIIAKTAIKEEQQPKEIKLNIKKDVKPAPQQKIEKRPREKNQSQKIFSASPVHPASQPAYQAERDSRGESVIGELMPLPKSGKQPNKAPKHKKTEYPLPLKKMMAPANINKEKLCAARNPELKYEFWKCRKCGDKMDIYLTCCIGCGTLRDKV